MNPKRSIFVAFLFISLNLFSQENDATKRQVVLKSNLVDSLYIFGQWNETGGTETHLKYLGLIETEQGNFKIMTSCWLWGLSKRATNRILVFSENNSYLGNYPMKMKHDLPERIENNQIVFLHSETDECAVITHLSFNNGIPEQFFLECTEGSGVHYWFNKE